MPHFSGLRILITGAGTGIGALLAEKLAHEGAEVVVTKLEILYLNLLEGQEED